MNSKFTLISPALPSLLRSNMSSSLSHRHHDVAGMTAVLGMSSCWQPQESVPLKLLLKLALPALRPEALTPSPPSCVIFGSHLDFYLSKGLDLIRGKQQARCMQGLPRASSIKWKTLCVWRLSNICIHTGAQAPESLGDGPASCHPHGFTPNKFCLQGRETHGKKFRYLQCLSRAYSENKTDTLKMVAQRTLSLNLNFHGSQEEEQDRG